MSDDKQLIDALCSVVGLKDSAELYKRVKELDQIAKDSRDVLFSAEDHAIVMRLRQWCDNAYPWR